jgi:hypothetical protein
MHHYRGYFLGLVCASHKCFVYFVDSEAQK